MSWMRQWIEQIAGLKRRWLGLIVGCLFWLVWMLFGLLATVMLIVCASVGFFVGRLFEEHQSWKEVVDKLLAERFTDS
jgi:uncharacterized membrane protein